MSIRGPLNLVVLLLLLATSLIQDASLAQETPSLAQQPVAILRSGGLSEKAVAEYIRHLCEDLSIGDDLIKAMEKEDPNAHKSKLTSPISGTLVYLTGGLIPSVEQIQFLEVADHAEFVRIVNSRRDAPRQANGEVTSLEGSGDRYKMQATATWRVKEAEMPTSEEPPQDDDEKDSTETKRSVTIQLGTQSTSGLSIQSSEGTEGKLVEVNGEKFREYSTSWETFYRYHDGFLFETRAESLWEMTLPSGDSLRPFENADVNGEMTFYIDRVPMALRQFGWSALSTAAGTELQQRDEEPELDYTARRSAGDAGLELVHAAMFDIDKINGWMKLSDGDQPIQTELRINSRANSDLGRILRDVASPERRLAPILKDNAALTMQMAFHLPDVWKKALAAYLDAALHDVDNESYPNLKAAEDVWTRAMKGIATHGNMEFCAKVGWSKESGGVIYGGCQLEENPELLSSLLLVLNEDATPEERCELVTLNEIPMLKIAVPADLDFGSVKLSHLYLANSNSCLWFAVGGENAHEIIRASVNRCNDAAGRITTPIAVFELNLQRWAEYPQDDPTGLTALHQYALTFQTVIQEEVSILGDILPEVSEESQALFNKAMALGGSQEIRLVFDADESGAVARGTVGSAIARGFAAIVLETVAEVQAEAASPADEIPTKVE